MSEILVHLKSEINTPFFRAFSGGKQSFGRTMGEALDLLTSTWEEKWDMLDVVIESLPTVETYTEPYLEQINGVWVVAGGGPLSEADAKRDFIAEMREERIQSFFPAIME